MDSVWIKDVTAPQFGRLEGRYKTDVLIVGGGMAGILCAYMLKRAGVDCILAEAKRICGGITQNTTAKITLLHGAIYHDLIHRFGVEEVCRYVEAEQKALLEYERICKENLCDYEKKKAFVYSLDDREGIEREVDALGRLGVTATFTQPSRLPFATAGAVCVEGQAQFHPLKLAFALARELPIFEESKILSLKNGRAVTERGEVFFQKAIVTTHFPFLNLHGGYFLKLYQERSYVIALKDAFDVDGMYVDGSGKGLSFRNFKNLLLLGGGAHRTGKKGGGWQELERMARQYYPKSETVLRWATQDCISLDHLPYIGAYAPSLKNIYVATGFSKWGMSSSMMAAQLLCKLVLGTEKEYPELLSPSRRMVLSRLAVNAGESILGLLTPTVPRCPHLGCALKYNRAEHSWDCPCHGSRFTETGEVIDNPATGDKKM